VLRRLHLEHYPEGLAVGLETKQLMNWDLLEVEQEAYFHKYSVQLLVLLASVQVLREVGKDKSQREWFAHAAKEPVG
jgi:hypothetical protein